MRIAVCYLIGEGEKVELPFVPYEVFMSLNQNIIGEAPAVYTINKYGEVGIWPRVKIQPVWDLQMKEDE